MAQRRSRFTIELVVETTDLTQERHEQQCRWLYRNMLSTNSDMRDTFYVAAVRDSDGRLIEFTGAGRGSPSNEIRKIIDDLTIETR
jgi:hypothetical protein